MSNENENCKAAKIPLPGGVARSAGVVKGNMVLMKKVTVIGMGLGAGTMTRDAVDAVAQADVLIGAQGMLDMCHESGKRTYPCYLPEDVEAVIAAEDAREFAMLVSGDVGFYSAAAGIIRLQDTCDLRMIPGVSTVSAFFARLKLPWQDAAFVSAHGRIMNIVDAVRRNRLTFCLTGNNTCGIGESLSKAGFGEITTHVGVNLGSERELVYETVAGELAHGEYPALTVLVFVNEAFDDRLSFGLPDSNFSRAKGIPMTKSETRAVVMSKLNIRPDYICWDVGAGTGSVTVEMALNAYRGHVFAIERREDAIPLVEQNCVAFHLGNVTAVCGSAPSVLEPLPAPDAVFIGGSGGELIGIIDAVVNKNRDAQIVVTAVTVETVSSSLSAFAKAGLAPEIVQINTARGKKTGELHLLEAQNPVTILSSAGQCKYRKG